MSKKSDNKNVWIGVGATVLGVAAIAGITSGGGYSIEVENSYTFDCNAVYNEADNTIKCSEQEISGTYSAKDNVKLMSGETELTSADGNFSKKLTPPTIPASEFETEAYITSNSLRKYGQTKETFAILEGDDQKLTKEVAITWNFTDADREFINNKREEWKAKKAAEEKAAAEQEAAEKAAAAAATPTPTTSTQSQQTTTTQNTTNGSTNSSPNSGVDYVVEGYCNDGTYVKGDPSKSGKASACYGHGGWRDY